MITAVSMWVLFSLGGKIHRISTKDKWRIAGIGFIAAMHWVSFFGAIKYANISVALVCFSSVGFFTALFEPLLFGRKFRAVELWLGLLAMAGIYIIFQFDPQYKTGIAIGVFSAMLGAIFPVLNRRLLQRMNTETLMSWEISAGFVTLSLLLPVYLRYFPVVTLLPGRDNLLWLLVLSWLCSVWAFRLSGNALQKISAFTVNLTYQLEPLYGITLAFIVYGENAYLHLSFYAGLFLILLAVALQSIRVYKRVSS